MNGVIGYIDLDDGRLIDDYYQFDYNIWRVAYYATSLSILNYNLSGVLYNCPCAIIRRTDGWTRIAILENRLDSAKRNMFIHPSEPRKLYISDPQ